MQWGHEAETDHVVAAIAREAPEGTFEQLTAKLTPVWDRIAVGSHFPTILDIGAGYGRVGLYLSRGRSVSSSRYVAVDISRAMLEHLQRYSARFEMFPGADSLLVRTAADALPLADGSVDLAVSSAVLLHMPRRDVLSTLAETARVLRPRGAFVFEVSFPNRLCPANRPFLLASSHRRRRANRVRYSAREVVELVEESGLPTRVASYVLEAPTRALLPNAIAGRAVPFTRRLNSVVDRRGAGADRLLGVSFTVTSLLPNTGAAADAS